MRLGTVLQKWRLLDGRSLRELGLEIGVSSSTLSRLERGKSIDADTFGRLLVWLLHAPPLPLFGLAGRPKITDADEPAESIGAAR